VLVTADGIRVVQHSHRIIAFIHTSK